MLINAFEDLIKSSKAVQRPCMSPGRRKTRKCYTDALEDIHYNSLIYVYICACIRKLNREHYGQSSSLLTDLHLDIKVMLTGSWMIKFNQFHYRGCSTNKTRILVKINWYTLVNSTAIATCLHNFLGFYSQNSWGRNISLPVKLWNRYIPEITLKNQSQDDVWLRRILEIGWRI